jgi:hypothetical protein
MDPAVAAGTPAPHDDDACDDHRPYRSVAPTASGQRVAEASIGPTRGHRGTS